MHEIAAARQFWKLTEKDERVVRNPKKHFTIFGGCEPFSGIFKRESIPNFTFVMLERDNSTTIVAPYPFFIFSFIFHLFSIIS